jgi:hypothetical protein
MKSILKIASILIATLVLSSCEDVIQVKLDEGSKLIVIDAFINDLPQTQEVVLTSNDSYFSNQAAPPITTAQVEVKDLNTGKVFLFPHTGGGKYRLPADSVPSMMKVNHQYELKVKYDGKEYISTSTLNRAAGLDSISAVLDEDGGLLGPGGQKGAYYCFLSAKDKVDTNTDYYWIKTSRNDTLFDKAADLNTAIDGTGGAVSGVPVDSLSFTPPATFLGFKAYKKNDKCQVEIHSISKECYFFLLQAVTQINNGGLFATTPENVKTNIVTPSGSKVKGVGWFNTAMVTKKIKIVN